MMSHRICRPSDFDQRAYVPYSSPQTSPTSPTSPAGRILHPSKFDFPDALPSSPIDHPHSGHIEHQSNAPPPAYTDCRHYKHPASTHTSPDYDKPPVPNPVIIKQVHWGKPIVKCQKTYEESVHGFVTAPGKLKPIQTAPALRHPHSNEKDDFVPKALERATALRDLPGGVEREYSFQVGDDKPAQKKGFWGKLKGGK